MGFFPRDMRCTGAGTCSRAIGYLLPQRWRGDGAEVCAKSSCDKGPRYRHRRHKSESVHDTIRSPEDRLRPANGVGLLNIAGLRFDSECERGAIRLFPPFRNACLDLGDCLIPLDRGRKKIAGIRFIMKREPAGQKTGGLVIVTLCPPLCLKSTIFTF